MEHVYDRFFCVKAAENWRKCGKIVNNQVKIIFVQQKGYKQGKRNPAQQIVPAEANPDEPYIVDHFISGTRIFTCYCYNGMPLGKIPVDLSGSHRTSASHPRITYIIIYYMENFQQTPRPER